jgi:hypothetical protein
MSVVCGLWFVVCGPPLPVPATDDEQQTTDAQLWIPRLFGLDGSEVFEFTGDDEFG